MTRLLLIALAGLSVTACSTAGQLMDGGHPIDGGDTMMPRWPWHWITVSTILSVGVSVMIKLVREAARLLGDDFDVRVYHDQVLGSGNIPLPVLERKIEAWIASEAGE